MEFSIPPNTNALFYQSEHFACGFFSDENARVIAIEIMDEDGVCAVLTIPRVSEFFFEKIVTEWRRTKDSNTTDSFIEGFFYQGEIATLH
jgi:hypothetical protein